MTNFPMIRLSLDDVDQWSAYFRLAPGVTAERAVFARELLIEWLRQIGAMEP
jgi:hypothetical protein